MRHTIRVFLIWRWQVCASALSRLPHQGFVWHYLLTRHVLVVLWKIKIFTIDWNGSKISHNFLSVRLIILRKPWKYSKHTPDVFIHSLTTPFSIASVVTSTLSMVEQISRTSRSFFIYLRFRKISYTRTLTKSNKIKSVLKKI